ncbi:hypothetical protein ABIE64_002661 [Thalassospira sp. MBR-102]|jgi:hypothetical protein|uniref:phage tail fiber domain-containing protein n=1 Tax=Thalassospira sp. MBR-102 TaxID=3156466 RepID=UPI003392EDF2
MSKYSEELGYGNGSTTVFTIPFKYLAKDHVKVYVDGEEVSFEWLTDFSISITPAPAAGVPVLRRRVTPIDKAEVDFRDGSNLEERDLDVQSDQLLFVTQETTDALNSRLAEDTTGEYDALDKRIQNVADPVEPADAVNKQYADQTLDAVEADRIAAEVARIGAETAQVAAETAQGASETAQGQAEANALASAASAQEAQDWVEMIGKYDVIRITSNYNLTAANLGNMIAVDASAGPVDVNVPSITILGEPFHWRTKKIDTTNNQVRVVSPDTIDGFPDPYVITATNAGATFQTDKDVENNIVTSAFGASANVVSRPFFFTATEGQTTFTGPDDYGNTLAYTPGKLNQVVVDGDVIDTRGMTAADGISLVFHEPLVAGQQVFCEPFASFAVASTYSSGEIDSLLTRVANGYIGEVIPMAGNTLPNGLLWCDGSEVSRTTYPDLFAYLGTIWGAGDGSTTFNLPDLREWFLRGASDAYPVGSEQLDQMQQITGSIGTLMLPNGTSQVGVGAFTFSSLGVVADGSSNSRVKYQADFDSSNSPGARTGDETRPRNKAVRFAIKAFHPVRILTSGAEGVSKSGDLMEGPLRLAGDAVLEDEAVTKRQLDAVDAKTDFTIIYPNGGSEVSPANVVSPNRYVEANPFADSRVNCRVEVFVGGVWADPGWAYITGNGGYGVVAGQVEDQIIVQTGSSACVGTSPTCGGLHGYGGAGLTSVPCRVLVHKTKGTVP